MNNHRQPTQPSALQLNQQVTSWNARYPVGSSVSYRSRSKLIGTKTTSEAWLMGGHSVVVLLEGVTGGVSINHLKPGNPSAHGDSPHGVPPLGGRGPQAHEQQGGPAEAGTPSQEPEPAKPGVCRICKCDEQHACVLRGGIACSWHDEEHTLCNNPDCLTNAGFVMGVEFVKLLIAPPDRAAMNKFTQRASDAGVKSAIVQTLIFPKG